MEELFKVRKCKVESGKWKVGCGQNLAVGLTILH